MEEYQKRVVEEKKDLDQKIVKLTTFLFSEASAGMDEEENLRMLKQKYSMMDYSRMLGERIGNFD